MNTEEGDIVCMDDPRFSYTLDSLPDTKLDMSRFDYTIPSRYDLYRSKLAGFDDLAYEIIELWENRKSNNDFKRNMKALHAHHKKNNPHK